MPSERWFPLLAVAAAVLVALVYLPVLHAEYVWDDWQLFINNPALRLPELLWHALWEPILPGTGYLRPVALASFAAQFLTVGIDPGIAHGINLVIHATNTLLVGLIASRLAASDRVSTRIVRVLFAALLYGLHPALIEMVAWVSGRFDLLVTFFILLALWGYLAWTGWRRDLWVSLCFLLAALSKEMAATLPLLLLLLYLGRQGSEMHWRALMQDFWRSREWRLYALLTAVAVLILVLRQTALGELTHQDAVVSSELEGFWHHIAYIGQTLLFYARISLWPFIDLGSQHLFDAPGMNAAARGLGIATVIIGLALVIVALLRRRLPELLLAGWGIALLPVLNLLPLMIGGSIGNERFLALPLVFMALGFAMLKRPPIAISSAMQRTLPILAGIFAVLLIAAAMANIRVTLPLWQNELSLWTWAYARYPDAPGIQANYAAAAVYFGDLDHAKAVFDRIKTEKHDAPVKMTTRQSAILKLTEGEYLQKANQFEKALETLNEALALSPTPPHELLKSQGMDLNYLENIKMNDGAYFYRTIYKDLAVTHLTLGHFAEALDAAQSCLYYAPTYPGTWLIKALALYGLDRWDDAENAFAQASHYSTDDGRQEAQANRITVLKQLCAKSTPPVQVCEHWQHAADNVAAQTR